MTSFVVVIPARYDSTRLPGKPLLDLCGMPLLRRTYERCRASAARRVVIATDDARIEAAAVAFGAEVRMTSASHPSGTDRVREAVDALALADDDIVVNVQGDEPRIPPQAIRQVATNLQARLAAGMATLCHGIADAAAIADPNVVKVVMDNDGYALYFSRAAIPHGARAAGGMCFQHIGIYAYRAGLLRQFARWSPTPLETAEKLEQLRALGHGVRIHVAVSAEPVPGGVDTPADLAAMRRHIAGEEGG